MGFSGKPRTRLSLNKKLADIPVIPDDPKSRGVLSVARCSSEVFTLSLDVIAFLLEIYPLRAKEANQSYSGQQPRSRIDRVAGYGGIISKKRG